jgi:uncharacterized protein YbdZ (MbtH family)
MTDLNYEDSMQYRVVKNHEEQFSIWPIGRDLPLGWEAAGVDGSKEACLAYIETTWTDMRPLSLRKEMERLAAMPLPTSISTDTAPAGPSLVERLSTGDHDVIAVTRPAYSKNQLIEAIERGFVQIEFMNTQGGTVLGFPIDVDESDISATLNTEDESGDIKLTGILTLNFQKVRCIANINLQSLKGSGRLELLN